MNVPSHGPRALESGVETGAAAALPPADSPFSAMRRALRNRPFQRLWAGEAASLLADQTFFVTLLVLVLNIAGPGAQLGAVLAVSAIPGAVLLPLGGWASDRLPRPAIMAVTSLGRALLMALLAGLVLRGEIELWHLYLLGGALSALDAFYYPATLAVVPEIVADDHLEPANALVQGAEQLSGVAGPVLGAALVATVGLGAAFGAIAITFLLAAAIFATLWIAVRSMPRPDKPAEPGGIAAIIAGVRYTWQDPILRVLIIMVAGLNVVAAGPIVVGSAVLATERFGGAAALGPFYAAFGIGSLVGVAAAGVLARVRRRGMALALATLLVGIALGAFGFAPTLLVAAIVAAGLGIAAGYLGVVLISALQERADPARLGRVMSLVVLATVALDPISYAVTGYLIAYGVAWLCLGAGLALGGIAILALRNDALRNFA